MIISHKYKCIFIRVPKTGSTSIETLLKELDPDCISSDETMPPYGHNSASQVKQMLDIRIWNAYFKFCFIRNPYKWFLSQYSDNMTFTHKNNTKIHLLLDDNYKLNMPKNNVITKSDACKLFVFLHKWICSPTLGFKHHDTLAGQSMYIDEKLDFVGKLENIGNDFEYIKKRLGIQESLKHLNKSNSDKLSYHEDAYKLITILYKEDITLYEKETIYNESWLPVQENHKGNDEQEQNNYNIVK